MMATKSKLGIGAICSVKVKFLRPSAIVSKAFPTPSNNESIDDLLAIKQDVRQSKKKDQTCIIFRHP